LRIGSGGEGIVWVLFREFGGEYAKEEEVFILGVWEEGVLRLNL